jgi:hypothetical protein
MVRSAEAAAREAKLAELKQLITSRHYESLEKLEDAVDALLWGDGEVAQFDVTQFTSRPDRDGRSGVPKRPR